MTAPQTTRIILASGSEIRAALLRKSGIDPEIQPARIDEGAIRATLLADGASPRQIADALAEAKARKVSEKNPDALVIGADQVLEYDNRIYAKPDSIDDARNQLISLRGKTHRLLSAATVCQAGQPVWRHIGVVRLAMREFTDNYLDGYLGRNWPEVRETVGCYRLEAEGVRLFSRIDGDYFNVLGLPLIEILTWLGIRGDIAT